MLIILTVLFVVVALPFLLPLVMPGWKSLSVLVGIIVVLLAAHAVPALWVEPYSVSPLWRRTELVSVWTSFPYLMLGVLARAGMLALRAEFPDFTFVAVILTLLAAPPSIYAYERWAWAHSLPDRACIDRPHPVELGRLRLNLPLAPVYGLWTNRALRMFCARLQQEAAPVKIKSLQLKFNNFWRYKEQCNRRTPVLDWNSERCRRTFEQYRFHEPDNPSGLVSFYLYVPGGPVPRATRGIASTFVWAQDTERLRRRRWFAMQHPKRKTPDRNPLTAICFTFRTGPFRKCMVAYQLKDSVHVMFVFRAKTPDIKARAAQIDAWMLNYLRVLGADAST